MKRILFICLCLSVMLSSWAQYSNRVITLVDRAAQDDGAAEWELAMMYLEGKDVPRHYYMAMHWMSQALAHGQEGRVRDFFRTLADCKSKDPHYAYQAYMKGMVYWLMEDDPNMGAFWFVRASRGGEIAEAQSMYCISYANFLRTVPGAEGEIRKLAIKRKEIVDRDPQLMTMEAVALFERGDTAKAIVMLEKASSACMPLADDKLGMVYLTSKGRFYDAVKAVEHFQRADHMKMLENHELYALCYKHGLGGLVKDSLEARKIEVREDESMRFAYLLGIIHKENLLKTAPLK